MALIGIGTVTVAALAAYLAGPVETRRFVRWAWGIACLLMAGVGPLDVLAGIGSVAGGLL